MKSLQLRFSTILFFSLLITFAILWWITVTTFRQLTEDHLAEHLSHNLELLTTGLTINEDGTVNVHPLFVEPAYQRPLSGYYYQISDQTQALTSPSLAGEQLTVPLLAKGNQRRLYLQGPQQQALLAVAQGIEKAGQVLTVTIAEDLSATQAMMKDVQWRYLLVALVLLITLLSLQISLLRSGLRPLKRIQNQLRELENGTREALDTDVPKEVFGLVTEVNSLLAVLQRRLQQSRQSLADLAHALKTPLTVIQQLAYQPQLSQQEDLNVLRAQTHNMHKLMNRVLKRARLADSFTRSKFNIQVEMHDLVNALQRIHRKKGLSVKLRIPGEKTVLIDREDMLELTGNLLDNACKWAHSQIYITVEVENMIRLRIEDDGPGVAATDIQGLSMRGLRLDEAVTGHGLGLSIARFICEQYGGQLQFSRSKRLGGFCVEAVLLVSEYN
jgi:signal transduction histidine kinase